MRNAICYCLILLSFLVIDFRESQAQAASPSTNTELPQGVGQDWWGQVQEQIAKDEYSIHWNEEQAAYSSPNRSQNLRFTYRHDGFSVKPRVTKLPLFDVADTALKEEDKKYKEIADWQIGFGLYGYGKGNVAGKFGGKDLVVSGNKAEVGDEHLAISFFNDKEGMRQNFIVKKRPEGGDHLQVGLNLATSLTQEVSANGVLFRLADGQEVMRYNGLKVWDNTGRELASHFRPGGRLCSLIIEVDDHDAVYPVTIDPLSSTAAWTAESDQVSANFGGSVSTAGDVNGDGYSDVIVGASGYDSGQSNEGRTFVYHGSATGLATTAAWTAESDQAEAYFGWSVSTAGDVNGDGYSDVIVGARGYSNGEANEGRAFVYHGSATGLSPTAAWTAESDQAYASFGSSVSTAGDVNGDGYSDIIVGAYAYDYSLTDEGRAFVYHGSATGLAPTAAWSAESDQAWAFFGYSVSTAGDVNGDGYSDVIVGAY
ncbi:MAG: integrin alpha, partial [Desulfocapsaceae bacterium]|nr:integrin alpha [Desulfocapsaceae bacterium]